jgi:hypothetical protein
MDNQSKYLLDVGVDTYSFDDLVTPAVAAKVLSISERTVKNWAYQNKLSHYKISNRLRFCIADLVSYTTDCRVEANGND